LNRLEFNLNKLEVVTYLRTHGKALRTEMMIRMFVMMPLAITAGCCTAR